MATSNLTQNVVGIDEQVKAAAADPTPGYLDAKVDGTTIVVSSNQLVRSALTGDVTTVGNAATVVGGNADTVTTNANLTGPVTSTGNATAIADGAIALSKIADGTDGEIPTWDASGVITTVPVGTASEVLTSNGPGAAPTFQAAGGGGALSFVAAVNQTGITSSTSVTIAEEKIYLVQYAIRGTSVSADTEIGVRINGDSGTNYTTNTYRVSGGAITQYSNNNAMKLSAGRRIPSGASRGYFWMNTQQNKANNALGCYIIGNSLGQHFHNPGDDGLGTIGGRYNVDTTITSFNIVRLGGTGSFKLDMYVYELALS